MKIALTGSNGFIGSNLLERFNIFNYEVDIFRLEDNEKIKLFYQTIHEKNYDFIINCAADLRPNNKFKIFLNEELPFQIQSRIIYNTKLIHLSSLNVKDHRLNDKYTSSKRKAEKNLIKKNLFIIRPTLVIDETYDMHRKNIKKYALLPFSYLPMIFPGPTFYPIRIDKLVNFIISLIKDQQKNYEIYNIIGSEPHSFWEIFDKYLKLRNKKALKIDISFTNKLPKNIKNFFFQFKYLQNLIQVDKRLNDEVDGKNIIL